MAEPDGVVAAQGGIAQAGGASWRGPAAGATAALALFCAAVIAIMLVRYIQERRSDPLNDPALVSLRERFAANSEEESLKTSIRERDLAVRRSFFSIQGHLNAGAWLLVLGFVPLVVLLNLLIIERAPAPDPESYEGPDGAWRAQDARWRSLAAFAVTLLVVGVIAAFGLSRRTHMPVQRASAAANAPD